MFLEQLQGILRISHRSALGGVTSTSLACDSDTPASAAWGGRECLMMVAPGCRRTSVSPPGCNRTTRSGTHSPGCFSLHLRLALVSESWRFSHASRGEQHCRK